MANPEIGATKGKIWRDAIRRAVQGDKGRIDRLAQQLVAKAEEGDMAALKEIGDRLDGKPKQQIDQHNTGETSLNVTIRRFSIGSDATP